MKVLVDSLTNTITGVFNEPLNFDISGHYVIDIPASIASVVPGSDNSVANLITAKDAQWLVFTAAGFTSPPTLISDELLGTPGTTYVDVSNTTINNMVSNGIPPCCESSGASALTSPPTKRVLIRPGGAVLTNVISVASSTYNVFFHFAGFSLYRAATDPVNPTNPTPGPSKMLYGYDPTVPGFKAFNPSNFSVSICDATTPFSDQDFLIVDGTIPYSSISLPATFRLKFVNNGTIPYYLSDWVLIYGT